MGIKNIESRARLIFNKYRDNKLKKDSINLASDIKNALENCADEIPVFIVSYNNGIYVENTINQLQSFGITPIIIDNNSTDLTSLKILKKIKNNHTAQVVFSDKNFGFMVGFLNHIYPLLPEVFAYSDPDLQFNKNLPDDFLSKLASLTKKYSVYKAGFALELLEEETIIDQVINKMRGVPMIYNQEFSVREWESQYWRIPISHDNLILYSAPIDTTFAVYKKSNYNGFFDAIRVAGDYSAIHLPWFPRLDLMAESNKREYLKGNNSSTWIK
ncbi:MAG TPA: glycosyltransferase family 2 protein [Campylobacterales bacterium]|nr:glycosyltransferase family 2 protein [Campylobacterales bacterium]